MIWDGEFSDLGLRVKGKAWRERNGIFSCGLELWGRWEGEEITRSEEEAKRRQERGNEVRVMW